MEPKRRLEVEAHARDAGWLSVPCPHCLGMSPADCPRCGGLTRLLTVPNAIGPISFYQYVRMHMDGRPTRKRA